MKVLLLQLDGKLPNIALMRIAAHCRPYTDEIGFAHCPTITAVDRSDWWGFDRIYASLIFERTRPVAEALRAKYRFAEIGGTGWDIGKKLEDIGITTKQQDYRMYPDYPHSIGFTQRGCRLKCQFCVVPRKEGAVAEEQTVWDIWRKEPFPRNLVLLDNDFFGQPNWRKRIEEIRQGNFKVSFNQGINCRMITDEAAAAIASVRYYDDDFKRRRIYTAWDNRKDEERLFAGLQALTKYGVKPDHIMVYMLVGYWPGETAEDRDYRRRRLREFGCGPYPMPYVRTPELVGFQRWVIGAYDKRFTWGHWAAADYRPEKLHRVEGQPGAGNLRPMPSSGGMETMARPQRNWHVRVMVGLACLRLPPTCSKDSMSNYSTAFKFETLAKAFCRHLEISLWRCAAGEQLL